MTDGRYMPMSEKTRQVFLENIEKCHKNEKKDLGDMLCKLYSTVEEKGVWVEDVG